MIYAQLFFVFWKIGLFAIGGAYAFLPLIQAEAVDKYHWLTKSEFLDVLGMVKIFPGAISIKFATYTGYKMGGIGGAVIANLANLLAPFTLILGATSLYAFLKTKPYLANAFNAIQWAIFAMIIAVAFQTIKIESLFQPRVILWVITAFILFLYTKVHPAIIIIGAGVLGSFIKI